MIEEILWEPWEANVAQVCAVGGVRDLWPDIQPLFNREFRQFVDDLMDTVAQAPATTQ